MYPCADPSEHCIFVVFIFFKFIYFFLDRATELCLHCTADLELDEASSSGQLLLTFVILILLLTYSEGCMCVVLLTPCDACYLTSSKACAVH